MDKRIRGCHDKVLHLWRAAPYRFFPNQVMERGEAVQDENRGGSRLV